MRRIEATLPALGSYTVPFHLESDEILGYIGPKELSRLDRVPHLGVASSVFTGVNHSRLEYLLLQCAIINLLPKFHKGKEPFALSGSVVIPGQNKVFSSGEELLKCWALLGNIGHAQYTYGVERSLLNYARETPAFKSIIMQDLPPNLKKYAADVIDNYDDSSFHYLLALAKISQLPKGSRLKAKLNRILATLLIPIDNLQLTDAAARYKIERLRRLFSRVRLLSIVSLDAYYSHHPIRYQISGTLMNLDTLLEGLDDDSDFYKLMRQTAAWLADEIYLHPRAATAQKLYELNAAKKLKGPYNPRVANSSNFKIFLPNLMNSGFGQPKDGGVQHLARLTFPDWGVGPVFGKDLYDFTKIMERELSNRKQTFVSVLLNPYSQKIHIDLLYRQYVKNSAAVSKMCCRTFQWVTRLVEAQIKNSIRALNMPPKANAAFKTRVERSFRQRFLGNIIQPAQPALKSLFSGVIEYILPDELIGVPSEVIPGINKNTIGLKIKLLDGNISDSITDTLQKTISTKGHFLSNDRIHELKMLQKYISKSRAPFIATCMEKFIIRDRGGGDIDEWDGVVLEIYDSMVRVSILEAKNTHPINSRANQAFKQLLKTRSLVKSKQNLASSRKRVEGYGAILSLTF